MSTTTSKRLAAVATPLSFDKFWTWLTGHANCIVRAGTPEAVLVDHEDFHWTLVAEDPTTLVVQLARAKDLVGELLVFPADIAYVQVESRRVNVVLSAVRDATAVDVAVPKRPNAPTSNEPLAAFTSSLRVASNV